MENILHSAEYYKRLYNIVVDNNTKKFEVILKKEKIKNEIYLKLLGTINTFPENELVNTNLIKITEKNLDRSYHPLDVKIDIQLIPIAKSIIKEVFSDNVGITKTGLVHFRRIFTIDDIKDIEFKKLLLNKINEVNLNKIISNLNKAISYKANYIVLNITPDKCWELLKTKLYKLKFVIEDNIIHYQEYGVVKISF